MKICAISDMHGIYDFKIPEVDVLFICGDIVPLKMQRNIPQSFSWFTNKFIPWCQSLPVEQVYMVAGNHDFFLENEIKAKEYLLGTKITILYNESAEYLDAEGKLWTIWGSPLCHIFGSWAFMYSDECNREQYEKMPKNVDFLITHDCGYGMSDQCLGFSYEYDRELHRGNKPLAEAVKEKEPFFHFTGHLHTADHNIKSYSNTHTVNVSLVDEGYRKAFEPLVLIVDKDLEGKISFQVESSQSG